MMCMKCGKNPATIHVNLGHKPHKWLCETCNPIKIRPTVCKPEKYLRLLRVKLGITYSKLSKETGIDSIRLCDFENGYAQMTPQEDGNLFEYFVFAMRKERNHER